MSGQKFFRSPFALSGDRTAIPDVVQGDGSISYPEGYGFDYERDPGTDPAAKRIGRETFNQALFDITENLRQYQLAGFPEWVTSAQNGGSPVAYAKNTFVRHDQDGDGDFTVYQSLVNNNTAEPGTDPSKWYAFDPSSTSAVLLRANNLSDLTSVTTARTNLGLGSMATQTAGNYLTKAAPAFTGGISGTGGAAIDGGVTLGVSNTPAGPTRTIPTDDNSLIQLALDASAPIAFAETVAADKGRGFAVELVVTNSAVPDWPASVEWSVGVEPQFSNGRHLVGFITFNGGGRWLGVVAGRSYAVPA